MLDDEQEEINNLEGMGKNPSSEAFSNNPKKTRNVTEEQMLDIAESILKELANKHIESGWSVKEVFDHTEIINYIPVYNGRQNVKALSAADFVGRMH